jgi:hypothetical protein
MKRIIFEREFYHNRFEFAGLGLESAADFLASAVPSGAPLNVPIQHRDHGLLQITFAELLG